MNAEADHGFCLVGQSEILTSSQDVTFLQNTIKSNKTVSCVYWCAHLKLCSWILQQCWQLCQADFSRHIPSMPTEAKECQKEKLQYTEQSQLQVHISSLHIPNQKRSGSLSTLPMNNPKKAPYKLCMKSQKWIGYSSSFIIIHFSNWNDSCIPHRVLVCWWQAREWLGTAICSSHDALC